MKKRILLLTVALLSALLLSGCAMRTVEDMYAIPKRSEEYSNLQSAIDTAMYGLTYSAPVSGENQQSVQMADLDGDGVDEYLVFAEGTSAKPLQLLIFRQDDSGRCRLMEIIESNGSAFEQVEYVDMDDKPGCELVVGRRVSDQILRSVSVYTFTNGSAEQLMMVGYSQFVTCDLDENGLGELMVILPGDVNTGKSTAVLYGVRDGAIERSVEAEVSEDPSHIKRIMVSRLHGGSPAVYVASYVDESTIITDIFAVKNGIFTNISYSSEFDTSIQTLRNYYIYADDLDDDGILELPSLLTMKAVSRWNNDEQKILIRWYDMDLNGREVDKFYSFHSFDGGWYQMLDSTWANRVSVQRDGTTCTFYVWDESYREPTELFSVYVLTGSNREEQATEDGCFALRRTEGVVYAAKLAQSAYQYGITEENLTNNFRLIQQDWKTGET